MAAPAVKFITTADMAGLRTLKREVDAFERQVKGTSKDLTGKLNKVADGMAATGKKLTRNLTLPIVGAGVAAFKSFADFETEISKIQGLVGLSADEVGRLEKAVLELAPATGKGPGELAKAMFFITSAGLQGADAVEVLEMSAKAAAAGLGDTATVADLATSAMNAYGADVLSATAATDTLTAAVRLGKLEPEALAGAMGMVLPIASAMGVGFDEVGAAMAAMSRTGTDASTAATQLRQIMATILSPTKQAQDAMAGVGLSVEGLQTSMREDGLLATLELVNDSFGGNVEATEAVFGNIRALSGVMDMLGSNVDGTREIFDDMTDVLGETERAFGVTSETSKFKLDSAIAQLQVTFVEFGGVVAPIVDKFSGFVSRLTEGIKNLSPQQKQWAVTALGVAAAIGPLLLIGSKLIKGVLGIIKVVKLLGAALSFLAANPVGLIIIAVAALVAGVIYAYHNFEWFRNGVQAVWEAIQKAVSFAWERIIKPVFDAIARVVTTVLIPYVRTLASVYTAVFRAIASIIGWAWNNIIGPIFRAIRAYINNVLVPIFNFFLGVARTVWSGLSSAISSAWSGISGVFQRLRDGIASVRNWFSDRIESIKRVFGTVKDAILAPFRSAFNAVARAWNNTIGGFRISIPDFPGVPFRGLTFSMPRMPEFRSGGTVPGRPGEPVIALLHGGETVLRRTQTVVEGGRSVPAGTVNVYVNRSDADPYEIGRELLWAMKVAG